MGVDILTYTHVDQILAEQGKVKGGTVISMIAAGIGYTWAANVIKWG